MSADARELESVAHDLVKASGAAQNMAREAVAKTAADITRDAKIFAPVDTGNLRASIGYDIFHEKGETSAEIGPTAEYGAILEEGTSTQAPDGYMGPAFDRRIPAFEQAMAQIASGVFG